MHFALGLCSQWRFSVWIMINAVSSLKFRFFFQYNWALSFIFLFPDSFDCVRQSLFPPLEKLCKSLIMNPFWYASGSLHLALHSGTHSTCTFDTITFLFLCLEINFLLSILLLSLPCLVAIQIVKVGQKLYFQKNTPTVLSKPRCRGHIVYSHGLLLCSQGEIPLLQMSAEHGNGVEFVLHRIIQVGKGLVKCHV